MLNYIFLGIVQGITEFLPISSSGHLVLIQRLLGVGGEELGLTLILHLGSILAVVIFFFQDILAALRDTRTLWLIFIATLITGVVGFFARGFFEALFTAYSLVALALIVNGIILIFAQRFINSQRKIIGVKDAIIAGLAQAIAIIPGISRSGLTISALLFRKVERQTSFKFSFIILIPAIAGATILQIKRISFSLQGNLFNLAAGFIASLISGLFALWLLKLILERTKLHYFGYYCILLGMINLLFFR
ncbi:MAG: undecaprenyl-diphosphate phosphatase [Candidatus Omnitrophica bacterium]|nr:undecaprenyl-diphosphate phosphatase [Candidatus Omnitrophota bacterium]